MRHEKNGKGYVCVILVIFIISGCLLFADDESNALRPYVYGIQIAQPVS